MLLEVIDINSGISLTAVSQCVTDLSVDWIKGNALIVSTVSHSTPTLVARTSPVVGRGEVVKTWSDTVTVRIEEIYWTLRGAESARSS